VSEDELKTQIRDALLDGLLAGDGLVSDGTRAAMLNRMIAVMPKADPVQWVESATISNGAMHIKLTPRAMELLKNSGWGYVDVPPAVGQED